MKITAADVAKLRKMTGAGMMDCKKALEEAGGDFDKAQQIIREKGKLVSAQRAGRETSEGVVVAKVVDGKKAYMTCLACETDFVAKNDDFVGTANKILDIAVENDLADLEALLAAKMGDQTVESAVTETSGQTGEKVELPFYGKIEAEMATFYVHSNNKIGAIVGFNKEVSEEMAYDVAMQVAAMDPISISEDDCPADIVEKEREIGREQARQEGKPENLLDRIADGKLRRYFQDNTLLNQSFIKDNKMTVADYLKTAGKDVTVTVFKRFSLS